jgi:hypothetical protein
MKINEASIFLGCEIDYSSERYLLVNLFSSLFLELQWENLAIFVYMLKSFLFVLKVAKLTYL